MVLGGRFNIGCVVKYNGTERFVYRIFYNFKQSSEQDLNMDIPSEFVNVMLDLGDVKVHWSEVEFVRRAKREVVNIPVSAP